MADESASIKVEADFSAVTAAAGKAAGSIDLAASKAAADAGKAGKATEAALQGANAELATLQKLAASAGGPIGALGARAINLAKASDEMGLGLGAAGVAAGAAVAGVAALAFVTVQGAEAIHAYITGADPLIKRLDQIAGSKPLPASSIAALANYRQETLGAEASTDRLHVVLAGFAAELGGPALDAVGGFVVKLTEFAEENGPVAIAIFHDMEQVARVVTGILSGGATEVLRYNLGLDGLQAAGHAAAEGLTDTANAAKAANDALSAGQKIVDIQTEAMLHLTGASDGMIAAERATEANNDALNRYVDTLDLSIPASKALADVAAQSVEVRNAQIVADAKAKDAAAALAEANRDEAASEKEREAAAKARLDAAQAAASDMARRQTEGEAALNAEADAAAERATRLSISEEKAAADAAKAVKKAAADQKTANATVVSAWAQGAQAVGGQLQGMVARGTLAWDAIFLATQGAAAGMTLVNTQAGAAQALASVPFPANLAAAATVEGVGDAALATILAASILGVAGNHAGQKGPVQAFPLGGGVGGGPDHVAVAAQPGEGFVGHRGMSNLDRLNAGQGVGESRVRLMYGSAQLASVLVDTLRRPGEARDLVAELAGARGAVAGHQR